MSQFNGRTVSLARMHDVIHIVGGGQIGPALDSKSVFAKGLGDMKLTKVDGGVLLSANSFDVFVPDAMFKTIQFAPEETAKAATVSTKK